MGLNNNKYISLFKFYIWFFFYKVLLPKQAINFTKANPIIFNTKIEPFHRPSLDN